MSRFDDEEEEERVGAEVPPGETTLEDDEEDEEPGTSRVLFTAAVRTCASAACEVSKCGEEFEDDMLQHSIEENYFWKPEGEKMHTKRLRCCLLKRWTLVEVEW
jgi:hypothetical protein